MFAQMQNKSKFVLEIDVHYLCIGFVKKFKSLNSAGVVPQRIEAFLLQQGEHTGETLALHNNGHWYRSIALLGARKPKQEIHLSTGGFLLLFSFFSFFLDLFRSSFSFLLSSYDYTDQEHTNQK